MNDGTENIMDLEQQNSNFPTTELETVTIRFAGDSGDGMQLTGNQFTQSSVMIGNDVITFPDYPAEIRAPAGTLAGVSGFELSFSKHDIHATGDRISVLIAMNPAALKVNLGDLEKGGILIVNSDSFSKNDLRKAEYDLNPLESEEIQNYRLVQSRSQVFLIVKEGVARIFLHSGWFSGFLTGLSTTRGTGFSKNSKNVKKSSKRT